MKKYSLIPHTADIRLKVEADSLSELFAAALEGMSSLMTPSHLGGAKASREQVVLQAPDVTLLLIDFLSEVLTLMHLKRAVYTSLVIHQVSETSLDAYLSGSVADSFKEDIKAVTYHEAAVIQNAAGNYETVIVFDI